MTRPFLNHPITDDSALGGAVIERSLRFNDSDGAFLNRTPSSASNRRTWTWSAWVKRSETSSTQGRLFGGGVTSSDYFEIYFASGDELRTIWYDGGQTFTTATPAFRDPNSWYHFVVAVDTTQAVGGNRILMYANGVLLARLQNDPAQNFETSVNSTVQHNIGKFLGGSAPNFFDGYMAEINFVDGLQLTPSYFGYTESQTGIWRPKKYEGTYGTNGFHLDFSDNSGATAATLGKDRSGQGNDFTPNNISVSAGEGNDSFEDTPTNNYPTLNSLEVGGDSANYLVYSNGNLQVKAASSTWASTRATVAVSSGKWYWEVKILTADNLRPFIGVIQSDVRLACNQADTTNELGVAATSIAYWIGVPIVRGGANTSGSSTNVPSCTTNDIVGVALDMDNKKVYFSKNGTFFASQDPANNAGEIIAFSTSMQNAPIAPAIQAYNNSDEGAFNFGQRPFSYTPPTGYRKLNSNNLPPTVPSINAKKHFDTLLYTGTGSTNHHITGLQFKPDFVWIKARTQGYTHLVYDSVRGVGKQMYPNTAAAEATNLNNLYSFNHNGFSLAQSGNDDVTNKNNDNFVAWCWKAGGNSNTFNVDGKGYASASAAGITEGNLAITGASINREAGFSIVKFTANNNASATIGHGLNSKPKFVIVKDTANSDDWQCKLVDDNIYFSLNTSTAGSTSYSSYTATDTLINLGYTWNNGSGTHIVYSWTAIKGYSSFGTYKGNGTTAGTFVNTGFSPVFIIYKKVAAENWHMFDVKRQPKNPNPTVIDPNRDAAETTDTNTQIDILSNGFKLRSSHGTSNAANTDYIYMAWAEHTGATPYQTEPNAR